MKLVNTNAINVSRYDEAVLANKESNHIAEEK
jgi:hypothetical protein